MNLNYNKLKTNERVFVYIKKQEVCMQTIGRNDGKKEQKETIFIELKDEIKTFV